MRISSTALSALSLAVLGGGARAQPIISEVLAASGGEGPDWVELQGQGSVTDISGWCLSDSSTVVEACRWRFADQTTLGAGELLVVELGRTTTGFALSRKGDRITLSDHDDATVVSVAFGTQRPGVSYGLANGETLSWRYFCTPTPGRPNGDDGLTARPDTSRPFALSVSPPRGIYDDTAGRNLDVPSALSIGAVRCGTEPTGGNEAASVRIRYTLDGSDPMVAPSSSEFATPFPLTGTTIL
eukprot:COSAG02_NODE_7960_length_2771_cov_3.466551_1_plen_241_part_10